MNLKNLKIYSKWCKTNLKPRIDSYELKLNMPSFTNNGDYCSKEPKNICGTCACFLGFAPLSFGVEERDYNDIF